MPTNLKQVIEYTAIVLLLLGGNYALGALLALDSKEIGLCDLVGFFAYAFLRPLVSWQKEKVNRT